MDTQLSSIKYPDFFGALHSTTNHKDRPASFHCCLFRVPPIRHSSVLPPSLPRCPFRRSYPRMVQELKAESERPLAPRSARLTTSDQEQRGGGSATQNAVRPVAQGARGAGDSEAVNHAPVLAPVRGVRTVTGGSGIGGSAPLAGAAAAAAADGGMSAVSVVRRDSASSGRRDSAGSVHLHEVR